MLYMLYIVYKTVPFDGVLLLFFLVLPPCGAPSNIPHHKPISGGEEQGWPL